jgi:hypothetical protein
MAAALRTVRVMLPRSLLRKLAVQAKVENRSLTYLILRAVKAELGAGKGKALRAKLSRRK